MSQRDARCRVMMGEKGNRFSDKTRDDKIRGCVMKKADSVRRSASLCGGKAFGINRAKTLIDASRL